MKPSAALKFDGDPYFHIAYPCPITSSSQVASLLNYQTSLKEEKKESESDYKTGKTIQSSFIKTYVTLGYYFCIIPFTFTKEGNIFRRKSHTIVCGLGHILAIHRLCMEIMEFEFERLSTSAVDYFLLGQKVATLGACLSYIRIFWTKAEELQKICTFVCECKHLHVKMDNLRILKRCFTGVCLGYLLLSFSGYILGIRISNVLSYRDPILFYRKYIAEARFALSLSRTTNSLRSNPPLLEDVTVWDHIVAGVLIFGNYSRCLLGLYWEGLLIPTSATLWLSVKPFYENLQKEITMLKNGIGCGSEKIRSILDEYEALKELSDLINNVTEVFILCHFVEIMLYYSIHINAIFIASDWYRQLKLGYLCTFLVATIRTSSSASEMVMEMKKWLYMEQVCALIPNSRMTALLDELSNHPVSISGSIYKITYQTSILMFSTVVTYFIICSQIGQSTETE